MTGYVVKSDEFGEAAITPPQLIVLAHGDTDGQRNHKRGHLFEVSVAQLLEKNGFEKPTRSNVNVKSYGIELDVVTRAITTGRKLLVECKAYNGNVPARELFAFRGKMELERYDDPDTDGLFVALPALTQDGVGAFKQFQRHDAAFTYWCMHDVVGLLQRHDLIVQRTDPKPHFYLKFCRISNPLHFGLGSSFGIMPDPIAWAPPCVCDIC